MVETQVTPDPAPALPAAAPKSRTPRLPGRIVDLTGERPLSQVGVARLAGVSPSQVWRWVFDGAGGVHLGVERVGGRWRTSVEEYEHFKARLADRQRTLAGVILPTRAEARDDQRRAARRAERLGFTRKGRSRKFPDKKAGEP